MSTAVAKRDALQEVCSTIDRAEFQAQLRDLLPEKVSLERFTRTAKLAVQLNPDILDVQDRRSLFISLVKMAADGLLPDGRQAALVKVKVKGKDTIAYWPMIGGLRYIAANHGYSLEAHCVFSNDTFDWELGFSPSVTHTPPKLDQERGELIGAYAVATRLEDGRKYVEVMSRQEIEDVRAKSPSGKFDWSPWNTNTAEMYRKTPAKRLYKQLPLGDLSEADVRVIASDDEIDTATAPVPALAGLPTDIDLEYEPVEGEVVEDDAA